ncbi:MAG: hypothetical protein WBP93_03670 [Pyrinomonadaceae bacterium]
MNEPNNARPANVRRERGGARFNFLIVATILIVGGYISYQYVPVAFKSYQYKDQMQQDANKAAALGKSTEDLRKLLATDGTEYGVPPDAVITVQQREGRMEARVQFMKPIEFPGYTYQYEFDQTVKSDALLSK